MNRARKTLAMIIILTALIPITAWAAPEVKLSISAEKEMVVEENGKQVTKLVPTAEVAPGEILIYTINYGNAGDEKATNVVLNNPIPEGGTYLPEKISENMDFSIDGGKTYKKPALLTYEVTLQSGAKETRIASPEKYTNVRWRITEIPAGEQGSVSFKVKIK